MRVGLLWFDPNPRRSAELKADDAAARFAERVGYPADACHVNPADLFKHPRLRVIADPAVHRNHFLVGREEPASLPQALEQRSAPARRSRRAS